MILAVDHINIVVSDLEQSFKFYTEVLGFKFIRRATLRGEWIDRIVGLENVAAEVIYIVAKGGEPRIELLHYVSPASLALPENSRANTIGLRHIALRIDNMEIAVKKLTDAGIELFSEPVTVPASVIEHDAGQKTLVYFTDPDGVILELAQYQ
jgi:catechol 2,3-dioxygenase-like lactoylglutathione lyase family enzyme